jgi:hypothetical protein
MERTEGKKLTWRDGDAEMSRGAGDRSSVIGKSQGSK